MTNLRNNISTFNTGKNSVRFCIGMQNTGKGLTCQAAVVRDGQQIVIGFLTSGVPSEWEEGKSQNFAVKADVFSNYIGKLLAFDADFTFDVSEKGVKVSLPGTATVTLPVVAESDCEPLIPSDEGDAYVAVEGMKATDFLTVLKRGGYVAKAGEDIRNITNHVAAVFMNGNMITMSADTARITLAEKPAQAKYNELLNALLCFGADERPSYVAKVQKGEITPEEYFKAAAEKGYRANVAGVSLPAGAVSTLVKLSGYGEKVNLMVTPVNLHLVTGNLKLCFTLGTADWRTYANFINHFDAMAWTKAVVDRDSLVNAFSIAELACGGTKPVAVEFTENGVVLKDCAGNKVKVGYVESMEGVSGNTVHINGAFAIEALSKFSGGNIVIGGVGGGKNPILFTDGTMAGENSTSKTYELQIMVKDKEEEVKEEKPKKAKKPKDVEDADEGEDIARMAAEETDAEETSDVEDDLPEEEDL